jgi:hypothetical protein
VMLFGALSDKAGDKHFVAPSEVLADSSLVEVTFRFSRPAHSAALPLLRRGGRTLRSPPVPVEVLICSKSGRGAGYVMMLMST